MELYVTSCGDSLPRAIGALREFVRENERVKLKLTAMSRTLSQNDISHVWYEQVALELREDTALGVKCESKLHCGVPILCAENAEYRALYDAVIRPLPYELKLEAMKAWPVTSEMTKPQMSQYLDDMAAYWSRKGVILTRPTGTTTYTKQAAA